MNATAHHTGIIKVGNYTGIRIPKDYRKSLGKDVVLEKTNEQNTVTGKHSAILGGSGNTDSGNAWAGVFGCGVAANQSCAFHANTYVAQNMCDLTTGGPPPPAGTLYFCTIGGRNQVFIV